MERPFRAVQAGRPAPLMVATRTAAASAKSVPAHSAASVEKFGVTAACAKPTVSRFGLPLAERAANAVEILSLRAMRLSLFRDAFRRWSVLEQ